MGYPAQGRGECRAQAVRCREVRARRQRLLETSVVATELPAADGGAVILPLVALLGKQEVEDVLRNHPAIFDCALIGVEDDRFGEAVAAAIVLNPGMELSDEDLIAYCRANLPSYKKPRYVAFVDALPHNVTGKIQKSVLRENAGTLFRPIRGL